MKYRARRLMVILVLGTTLLLLAMSLVAQGDPRSPVSSVERAGDVACNGDSAGGAQYCFIKGLIHPATGLVGSREGECFTKVYKNALAAMAFVHEGDLAAATSIFAFFQSRLTTPFAGFTQNWDACTGQPDMTARCWEGDNAFLLLALNYYAQVNGSYGAYEPLAQTLAGWLRQRAATVSQIEAEGTADMYAALAPLAGAASWDNWIALTRLDNLFYHDPIPYYHVDFANVADHAVRALLVFGDRRGFDYLGNFKLTDAWCVNGQPVTAYKGAAGDDVINAEIHAQIYWPGVSGRHNWAADLSWLRPELEKMLLPGTQNANCSGLPYLSHHPATGSYIGDCSTPIIDPTAYLLFDSWQFNPFAPGRQQAGCAFHQFLPLTLQDQGERFPRLFRAGQDTLKPAFPQEINDGGHKQIVVAFQTATDLAQTPVTLTVATVARSGSPTFAITATLDDGDHCLQACDRQATLLSPGAAATLALPGCRQTHLPIIGKSLVGDSGEESPATSAGDTHIYQLILQGSAGWGVFDWLQLETPGAVLWTIGNKDGRCSEFDNEGFSYQCS